MGAPSLPSGPIQLPQEEPVTTTTGVPDAARILAPTVIAAKPAMETTHPTGTMTPLQNLKAMVIKSHQAADVLQSLKPQTPINIPLLNELLVNHPDQKFVCNLTVGLSQGFRVGYRGGRFPRIAKNLPSANQHPSLIEGNLLHEVQLGRMAGPFESPPFKNFQIHPLGLVPKKNSQKWRTIFHLSYPKG
ncbi:MAG: hypothetical protein OIF58_03680, partial [Cohaesibacter sp.]|nr:hypothetical protein [Cohaesibacter sp.]